MTSTDYILLAGTAVALLGAAGYLVWLA